MPDSNSILALSDLQFRWSKDQPLCLDIPSFSVDAGERVFLFGPSGSGKSTLLGLLGGVLTPDRGSVCVLGEELTQKAAHVRDRFRVDHIGFIFQQFNLIPYLSVLDNVLLPCRFSARRRARATADDGKRPADEAARLLSHLDLDQASLQARKVTDLSVGQQQRVAVARALIGQPEIVIADEPTSSLDAERQASFLDLLMQECHASGATLLFVSHDHRLSERFTQVVALNDINRAAIAAEAA
jgi:putative ABC transport system ATP-binding protein